MTKDKTYEEASEVSAIDGEVNVDGPDHVAVKLTPEAALKTGNKLIDGAMEAAGQRHFSD